MRTLHAQTAKTLHLVAKKLVKLERSGRYDDGLDLFGENWRDPAFLPETAGLTDGETAEVLLRFGSLIGFAGSKHQTEGAQERSKNILTGARELFAELGNAAKTAECENYIALAYWRTGEFPEARTWIDEALSHDLPNSNDARLYAHLTKSLLFLTEDRYEENVANCQALEDDFRAFGDAFLNGSLCANLGLSLKNLSRNAEATIYLSLAISFHEKSLHKVYLGTGHNNLAQLYKAERRFESAHESIDAAIKTFRLVRDRTREAFSLDTKAQIYFAQRNLPEALAAADKAISVLRKGEVSACLAESLTTKSKILLFADNFSEAILNLIEAVNITRIQNGEAPAKALIDNFAEALKEKDQPPAETHSVAAGDLELVLPPAISHYDEYKGVWINTSHLEDIGVRRGSLAIIVPDKVKRGDLVAVTELESDLVICGFYDYEFGIVCLERGDDDPQLFDETDIRVLGKIVGVCNSGKDPEGKMIVEALAH